ncbi:MAG: hypothetical protein ACE5FS_14485 [Paracoccaceae bacterium]
MKRRDFSRALVASSVAGALPVAALANQNDEKRRDRLEALARVTLVIATQIIILQAFAILNPGGFLGLDLRRPVPQYKAGRASLGNLPVLGRLLRPSLTDRFAGASLVGFLVLVGSILLLLPIVTAILNIRRVVIVHEDKSYEPNTAPVKLRLSKIPDIGDLSKRKRVGKAYRKGRELIVLVSPSVIRGDDF